MAKWQGSSEIKNQLGPTMYKLATPGQGHASLVLHVNLMCNVKEEGWEDQYLPQSVAGGISQDYLKNSNLR